MKGHLKIYRASAGSGKTFTLALEYIKLLIADPKSYRRILAVTFTNKATAEMKERILGKLYGVANGLQSAADYTEKIKQQLPGYSDREIQEKAGEALDNILHDYGPSMHSSSRSCAVLPRNLTLTVIWKYRSMPRSCSTTPSMPT